MWVTQSTDTTDSTVQYYFSHGWVAGEATVAVMSRTQRGEGIQREREIGRVRWEGREGGNSGI